MKKLAGLFLLLIILATIGFVKPSEDWNVEEVESVNKLVFNMPNMDKQMCETFPKTVVASLESTEGILDVQFNYDGHSFIVFYDPLTLLKTDILENDLYAWVGVEFISNTLALDSAKELYDNRNENNDFIMPNDHMSEVDDAGDAALISGQNFPKLVDASWLNSNKDNVKVIEIGPVELFSKGHFPGALNLDISQIRRDFDGVQKQMISEAEFAALIKGLGISENDRVVVYSSVSLTHASRLYLTFKHFGHKSVTILDGGKASLQSNSLTTKTSTIEPTDYLPSEAVTELVDSEYVESKLDDENIILLDVRNPEEFSQGRIPGAINIDWTNLVDKEGKLKDETSLRNLLKLNPNREIIVYCVSGTRASYAWFVLSEILRFNDVNVFDGSMIEWDYYKFVLEK